MARPRGGPRPIRPKVTEYGWAVELRSKRGGWFIACAETGPAVFFGLTRARTFQSAMRDYRAPNGRRPYRLARVRRVKLTAWGCAV